MSAIPFGLHQGPSAADGYLIGRVNQELMSGELMRSRSTVHNALPPVMLHIKDCVEQTQMDGVLLRLDQDGNWLQAGYPTLSSQRDRLAPISNAPNVSC